MKDNASNNAKAKAAMLITQGYRRVSNSSQSVARIDREDWIDITCERIGRGRSLKKLVKGYYSGNPSFNNKEIKKEVGGLADYYRRCISKDIIRGLSPSVFRLIPGSAWDATGYCKQGEL